MATLNVAGGTSRYGEREKMKSWKSGIGTATVVLLGAVALSACATKDYVNKQVATVDTHVADVNARVSEHDTRISNLDKTAQDALDRANAAGKLAEGKFLYQEVLSDDSMKFPVNKADLSPEAQQRLDAFIEKLKADNKNVYVEVQGHTDNTGAKDWNYKLGEERAEAVRRYLNQHGVALNRIGTISYGADAPVAPNNNRDGRKQNRRVVLIVLT
jgi:outer membrane protein OmpA-like peptidoglycan-associated protein